MNGRRSRPPDGLAADSASQGSSRPPRSTGDGTRANSWTKSPKWLLLAVAGGIFFGTLDQTVVVTVLPAIIKDIHLPLGRFGAASWIVNGYLLGYIVAMPTMGRIADAYGRLRTFLICLTIFALGSALVAVSPNLSVLVGARVLQAVGGGGLLPIGLAITADVVSPSRRVLVMGAFAATNNGSTFLGPLWGAGIADIWDWRTIFWLNVVFVLPLAAAVFLLGKDRRSGGRQYVDWCGVLLLTLGLSAVTFALTDDGANPRPLAVSILIGLMGLLLLAVFVRREWRSPSPLAGITLLRSRAVAAAMLTYFLIGGALVTALVSVPLMTDVLFGGSTTQGGLNLMRLLLLLPVGGVAGGWLSTRAGYRMTVLLGLVVSMLGFLWMRAWPFHPGAIAAMPPSSLQLWGALGAVGLGLGLCDAPIVATVVDIVAPVQRAVATSLLLVMWTGGMIGGMALLATQGLGAFTKRIAGIPLDAPAYQSQFQGVLHRTFDEAFLVAAAALALACVIALAIGRGRAQEVLISPYDGFAGS